MSPVMYNRRCTTGREMTNISVEPDDDLYILRERATCPICKEFYSRPRKLSCCHVVCLDCIKRHVSMRQCNFPPCPLCRRPIINTDFTTLEPALAEQDIVSIVKKYETCDICKRKEHPSLKCLECKYLICRNCLPCHEEYNPLHMVIPILDSQKEGKQVLASRCDKHPDQYLTLYCLMCKHVLCSYCDKHLHDECRNMNKDWFYVRSRFDMGLLREYASSSNAVKPLGGFNQMPACLYIKDFSIWALDWLSKAKIEVEQCISFFRDCSIQCSEIVTNKHDDNFMSRKRKDSIISELSKREQTGIELKLRMEEQIQRGVAADIARSVLQIEAQCINLFRMRSKYSREIIPSLIKYTHIKNHATDDHNVLTFTSKVILKAVSDNRTLLGIFTATINLNERNKIRRYWASFSRKAESSVMSTVSSVNTDLFLPDNLVAVFHKHFDDCVHTFEIQTFSDVQKDHLFVRSYSPEATYQKDCLVITNDLFTNDYLDEEHVNSDANSQTNVMSVLRMKSRYFCELPSGFNNAFVRKELKEKTAENYPNPHLVFEEPPPQYRSVPSCIPKGECALITHFVKAVSLYPKLVKNILLAGTNYTYEHRDIRVDCIIGNTKNDPGLETVFYYRKATARKEIECVLVSVPRLKVHGNYRQEGAISKIKHSFGMENRLSACIQDENACFCICSSSNEQECQITFRSNRNSVTEIDNSMVFHNGDTDHEFLVRKTFLKADLLCSLNQGLMFVSRGCDLDEIYIGKIVANEETINVCVLLKLHQNSVAVQIEKLVPLAMVETRDNYLLVVCATDGENDKLAMIWPEKTGADVLEILEVNPSAEFATASIVDLEIDPVGNIMYVLENQDGKSCCVCTRYFMPPTESTAAQ